MPAPSPLVKQHTNYFGGEVVILPSGKAVRLHEDKLNEINEAIDAMNHRKGVAKRKRKSSIDSLENASPTAPSGHPAFEVLPKNALMNMMPPPPSPMGGSQKMGLLGQHLISGSGRGSTPRGRRGTGSRGGRRPKNGPRMPPVNNPSTVGQNNLALLAQAINHQEQQEKANSAVPMTNPTSTPVSEPPQVAITPPKVVVVTTPSGTVLRTTNSTAETPTDTVSTTSATGTTCSTSSQSHVVTTVGATATSSTSTPVNSSSKTPKIATAATVKLKVGDSPMKVYPVGARILPKTASAGSTGSASGSPVFMVATSVSQNLIQRVGQKQAQTVTLTSGQRVVTVNTASLRPGAVQQVHKTSTAAITSAIKTLQPRVVSSSGGQVNKVSKPSVIVVQRSQSGATKALVTKELQGNSTGSVTTTRILQTKPAKQPIVIVSKSSAAAASGNAVANENNATVSTTQASTTTPNQVRKNNVCDFVNFGGIFFSKFKIYQCFQAKITFLVSECDCTGFE